MNTPTAASKDTVLMSSLLLSGLLMAFAVPVLNAQDRRVDQAAEMVVKSAGSVARSLAVPAALRHTQALDAAIISAAPDTAEVKVAALAKSRRADRILAI